MPLQATSGAASYDAFGGGVAAVPNYIEDVFSTYLWTTSSSDQTLTTGIDMTKGALTWLKGRSNAISHILQTGVGGGVLPNNALSSNNTNAYFGGNYRIADSTTGFTVGTDYYTGTPETAVAWTFRKQPKFFDVVTLNYTSGAAVFNHSLGSVPGFVILKVSSGYADNWWVYHRSLGNDQYVNLNLTSAAQTSTGIFSATDTTFTVKNGIFGASTIVAYLFAHNAGGFGLTGTENVISCGSFTDTTTVNLGYEPQWVLFKKSSSSSIGDWFIADNMRGFSETSINTLSANTSSAEASYSNTGCVLTSTGFTYNTGLAGSGTFIYIAIRRGPMKVPTSGTSVFYPNAVAQADSPDSSNVPFPPDLVNTFSRDGVDRFQSNQFNFVDRLRGLGTPNNTYTASGPALTSSSTIAESSTFPYVQLKADSKNITRGSGWNSASYGNWIYYFMRRAPSFFDEVCYTGTGSAMTVNHNLGVAPEMMIVKRRSGVADWPVYSSAVGNTKFLLLNSTGDTITDNVWNNTTPTATEFSVRDQNTVNASGSTYVAYLFASVTGVSKVGSYTGTGTTQTIDCGFTSGARFVLIKRSSGTGDWYVWDSARGIVAGNDPYLLLNSTAAEVTNTDYIDTAATGFEISSTAPAAINANGGTFIFLAIA